VLNKNNLIIKQMSFWIKRKIKDFDLKIFFLIFFSLIIFITSGAGADFVWSGLI